MFRAHAKINLGLYVVERRADGYHNIETVFHRIALADTITFTPAPDIAVTSSSPEVPSDLTNICFKAALLLRDHLDISSGVHIHIEKQIPVGAGLGGGSSDAACVLRELPAFWGRAVSPEVLRALALQLGSDVPYFLASGSAFAGGRGELLEYFDLDIPYAILLCYPNVHVATGWAYGGIRTQRREGAEDLKVIVQSGMKHPEILASSLRNDFEPVVFAAHPAVREVKQKMIDAGALFALMSGSGSSVYGFFNDSNAAAVCADPLGRRGYRIHITDPHFRG